MNDQNNKKVSQRRAAWPSLAAIAALSAIVCINTAAAPSNASCARVDAYWNTNLSTLKDNITGCTVDGLWHKCSQAAAIHYDLENGSLGQRARSCGLLKPIVPGDDFTTPTSDDSTHCKTARYQLRSAFENRALARLACAAARIGGDNQEALNAKCIEYRARLTNYHAPFRSVAKHCQLDYEQTYEITASRDN
jgi:hypothetical protein